QESLHREREQIAVEMKKRTPDITFVDSAMSIMFSLRRQEVVEEEPPVSHMKVRQPALYTERQ
ncbi:hypothetical protein KOW79_000026, partial [Hemibagrus wyckioides]